MIVCPFTFEEAFERFREASEVSGHVTPVHLIYSKGNFTLIYDDYEKRDQDPL